MGVQGEDINESEQPEEEVTQKLRRAAKQRNPEREASKIHQDQSTQHLYVLSEIQSGGCEMEILKSEWRIIWSKITWNASDDPETCNMREGNKQYMPKDEKRREAE